jgi:prevent-host-death family protein
MDKPISAAEANRKFSALLHGVRTGHSYVVTSHGKPVARIVPVDEAAPGATRARTELIKRLKRQATIEIGRWSREELYEDER